METLPLKLLATWVCRVSFFCLSGTFFWSCAFVLFFVCVFLFMGSEELSLPGKDSAFWPGLPFSRKGSMTNSTVTPPKF